MRSVTVNTWRTRPGPSLPAPISFPLSAPDKPGCLPLKRQACPQLRASGYPWTPAGHVLLDPAQRSVQTALRGATAAPTPRALVFLQGTHGRDRERVRPACFSSSAAASGPRSPGRQGRHPIGGKNTRRLKWTARLVTDGQKGSLCVAGGRGACSSAMGPTCPSALLHPGPGPTFSRTTSLLHHPELHLLRDQTEAKGPAAAGFNAQTRTQGLHRGAGLPSCFTVCSFLALL